MKVAVETYGCTMNQADSDILRGLISQYYTLSESETAEVVVINSCGVVEYTERKIIRRLKELKKKGKRVVLAGCLPRISPEVIEMCDAALSPDNADKIIEAIRSVEKNQKAIILQRRNSNRGKGSQSSFDKSAMHHLKCRLRENVIAIVSISEGCVGSCSFCATRFARGKLKSFSSESIITEIAQAVREGFKEIQLTSQDTGAYGLDKGKMELPNLLKRISEIEGEFRVRVGMMNPQHARAILNDLIEAFNSEKIYKFLHIPVQSGDNKVLKDMRRDHTVEDFLEVVEGFRSNFEDVMISTDLIVGFPTETEEAFWKSYELVREVRPDIVNITRYSPRTGTPASRMKDIPGWVKKERSRILTDLCRNIGEKNNRKFLGKRLRVLITRRGKDQTMLARSSSYRPVITHGMMGEFKEVTITDCSFNYLVGK
jgi:MiaB-like tRNA modifying enzyme